MSTVVIDSGSGSVKSGFSGDDTPTCIVRTVVGISRYYQERQSSGDKTTYVGEEAVSEQDRRDLELHYPIERGIVTDWEGLEHLWRHSFEELGVEAAQCNAQRNTQRNVETAQCNVMLTGNFVGTKLNKERPVEIMFERFGVSGVYVADQFQLALYSVGKTTGVVVEIGEGVSHTVPVYEGYSLPHATLRFDIAGRSLTEYLSKLLVESGGNFSSSGAVPGFHTSPGLGVVTDIKETKCYVSLNYEEELTKLQDTEHSEPYPLPDGNVIQLREQRFKCPEALFEPGLVGVETEGLHHKLHSSIRKCDVDLHNTSVLYKNVVLCGGSSLFPGLRARLEGELRALAPSPRAVTVCSAEEERRYAVWVGGSVLSALSTFQDMWVTKLEYEEHGPSIVHRKCF